MQTKLGMLRTIIILSVMAVAWTRGAISAFADTGAVPGIAPIPAPNPVVSMGSAPLVGAFPGIAPIPSLNPVVGMGGAPPAGAIPVIGSGGVQNVDLGLIPAPSGIPIPQACASIPSGVVAITNGTSPACQNDVMAVKETCANGSSFTYRYNYPCPEAGTGDIP
jgi:hypothetical protein